MKKNLLFIFLFFLSTQLAFSADMRFIQVDGAFYNTSNSKNFENLVEKINNEKNIDFVVFTGNNIAKPNKDDLNSFIKSSQKLKAPFYVVLGQKDVNKQKGLGKEEYVKILSKKVRMHKKAKSPNLVFRKNKVTFIIADGSKEVLPTPNGYYKDDVLSWIKDELDNPKNQKVVILQHYPLIPPIKKETHYTYRAEDYLKLLSNYKNVKAIVSGHFDANNEQTVNGILHISTKNAPTYRIIDILDYDTENPTFWSTIKE